MKKKPILKEIENILTAAPALRAIRLTSFLKDCSERQRAALLFIAGNPMVTPAEYDLTDKEVDKVYKSVKDKKAFDYYDALTDTLRDLCQKLICSSERGRRAMNYVSCFVFKIVDCKNEVKLLNEAIALMPEDKREDFCNHAVETLDNTAKIKIDEDEVVAYFSTDGKTISVDVDEFNSMLKDNLKLVYSGLGEMKAFEQVFAEAYKSEVFGEDVDAYLHPIFMNLSEFFEDESSYNVQAYSNDVLDGWDIPYYKNMEPDEFAVSYLKNVLRQWQVI